MFILLALLAHLVGLHERGRVRDSHYLGYSTSVSFKLFAVKDLLNLRLFLVLLLASLLIPYFLRDPDASMPASLLKSPAHIMPA